MRKLSRRNGASSMTYRFSYDYDEFILGNNKTNDSAKTTGVILIHPIGVGIGKWYHTRLFDSLSKQHIDNSRQYVFLSPDLLGSATASGPSTNNEKRIKSFPLLKITDWSNQLMALMKEYESKARVEGCSIHNWAIVANGGCSPIALQIGKNSITDSLLDAPVINIILSSPPRLPFFLESTNPIKVHKSYVTLSGILGKVFWWYALRRKGKFIQQFSEKNLVGNPSSLGEDWTPNCLDTAKLNDGQSKCSTFAFLAGALQDGCVESLNVLSGTDVNIDFIRGKDVRRNRARSWFWGKKKMTSSVNIVNNETIQQFVERNGNGGRELFVEGRVSLAWEDADGYAKCLMELLSVEQ